MFMTEIHGDIAVCSITQHCFNTFRPSLNGRYFADDILKRVFLNENGLLLIKISLNIVP